MTLWTYMWKPCTRHDMQPFIGATISLASSASTCDTCYLHDSLSGISGLQGVPLSSFSCTRTRPSTHHSRGYDLRCSQ
jgi:hypothetical protein